jgi:hypothetical protein
MIAEAGRATSWSRLSERAAISRARREQTEAAADAVADEQS